MKCENCQYENDWNVEEGDHCDNCGKSIIEPFNKLKGGKRNK